MIDDKSVWKTHETATTEKGGFEVDYSKGQEIFMEDARPECICGEINARHCPVHSDDKPHMGSEAREWFLHVPKGSTGGRSTNVLDALNGRAKRLLEK